MIALFSHWSKLVKLINVNTKSSQQWTLIGWEEQILEIRVSWRTAAGRDSVFCWHLSMLNLVLLGLHNTADTKYRTSIRKKRIFLTNSKRCIWLHNTGKSLCNRSYDLYLVFYMYSQWSLSVVLIELHMKTGIRQTSWSTDYATCCSPTPLKHTNSTAWLCNEMQRKIRLCLPVKRWGFYSNIQTITTATITHDPQLHDLHIQTASVCFHFSKSAAPSLLIYFSLIVNQDKLKTIWGNVYINMLQNIFYKMTQLQNSLTFPCLQRECCPLRYFVFIL